MWFEEIVIWIQKKKKKNKKPYVLQSPGVASSQVSIIVKRLGQPSKRGQDTIPFLLLLGPRTKR